jgi:hypothetical protein
VPVLNIHLAVCEQIVNKRGRMGAQGQGREGGERVRGERSLSDNQQMTEGREGRKRANDEEEGT